MTTFHRAESPESGTSADRIIMFLGGLQDTGMLPGSKIARELGAYGPVLSACYPMGRNFAPRQLVRDIYQHVQHYPRITFIGTSTGVLLAHDTIAYAKRQRQEREWELVAIDGLTGQFDLKDTRARFVRYLPPVSLPQWMNRRIFGGELPPTEMLDPNSQAEWEEHIRRSHSFDWGTWVRQLRYTVEHPGPRADVMRDVNTVYLKSARDPFLRYYAYQGWADICPRFYLLQVGEESSHCNLLEYPSLWTPALKNAMKRLEYQRV